MVRWFTNVTSILTLPVILKISPAIPSGINKDGMFGVVRAAGHIFLYILAAGAPEGSRQVQIHMP